jgi:DNA-binding response OmpR family regulator
MKALLVIDSDSVYQLVAYYLKPLGFEFVRYRTPLKAMDNVDEVDPEAVIISAEDFPRHWKTIAQFIRSDRNKEKTTVVVLKGPTFSYEDAAKAARVGVNGIASDDLSDPVELERLQDILARYRPLRNRRSARRIRPVDSDRIDFLLSMPGTGTLVSGKVVSLSSTGLAFEPDEPGLLADSAVGTDFPGCSLRVDDAILSPSCRLVRTSPSFAFAFSFASSSDRTLLEKYMNERHAKEARKLA